MISQGIRVHKSYEQMRFKQPLIIKEEKKEITEDFSFAQILAKKMERGRNNGA